LGVDAFVTGSLNKVPSGDQEFIELSLQIISASRAAERSCGGKRCSDLLATECCSHTDLASTIASQIGKRFTASSDETD
jgi:hypothetical protein